MRQARTVAAEAGQASPRPHLRRAPKKLHGYFVVFTIVFAVVVLTGFSRTFFLPMARGSLSKPLVVHLHGAFFFAWTGMLLLQAGLAATKRLKMHRRVGSVAGWLVLPMLFLGTLVASRDTVHDFYAGDGDAALSFYYGELADLAMFGLLAGGAMLLRQKPDFHKRWVILGSLGLIGAAIGRIPEISSFFLYIYLGFIASVAVYDIASRQRVHLATIIGAAVLLFLGLTEERIGNSTYWLRTAHHLLAV
ncbi:hypothetical protein ABDK56_10085 [Sphingomonas sp. ASV193]|uniref:hypothetical protein n=1 Tax=Sphingomonas sp. ASV193 TaxID=3144405 RepID=UPI0032E8A658